MWSNLKHVFYAFATTRFPYATPIIRSNGFIELCPLTEINLMLLRGGGEKGSV
jgi:hypothetical protein